MPYNLAHYAAESGKRRHNRLIFLTKEVIVGAFPANKLPSV